MAAGYLLLDDANNEIDRLDAQAAFLKCQTKHIFTAGGLAAGMSVIDIGTGLGHAARIAAEIVGPSGKVVAIDIEPRMIDAARAQARRDGLAVRFHVGTPASAAALGRFDFAFSRLVTPFQADKLGFLQQVASLVKPGGMLGVVEPGWTLPRAWSDPPIPRYDTLMDKFLAVAQALEIDIGFGSALVAHFEAAGLGEPSLSVDRWAGGPASGLLELNISTLGGMFARGRDAGLDAPDEPSLRAMYAEIKQAAQARHVQFNGPSLVGAWSRIRLETA